MTKSLFLKSIILLIWTTKIATALEVCDDSNDNIISTLYNIIDDSTAKGFYQSCAKAKLQEFSPAQLVSIIQLPPSRRESADELFPILQPKLKNMNLEQMNSLVRSYKDSTHLSSVVEELLSRQDLDESGMVEILNASNDPLVRQAILKNLAQLTANFSLSPKLTVFDISKVFDKIPTLSELEKRDFAADVFNLHPFPASEWANLFADDIMSLKIYTTENAPLILSEIEFKSSRDEAQEPSTAELKNKIYHANFLLPLFEQNLPVVLDLQGLHEQFLRSSEAQFQEYEKATSTLWDLVNDPIFSKVPPLPPSTQLSDALVIRTNWVVETLNRINHFETDPHNAWIRKRDPAILQLKKASLDLDLIYINFENAIKSLSPTAAQYHKMTDIRWLANLPKISDAESQSHYKSNLKLMREKHERRKAINEGLLRLGNALRKEKEELQSWHDEVLIQQVRPDCEKLNQNLDKFKLDQFFHFWN